jgi:hypothetical protein
MQWPAPGRDRPLLPLDDQLFSLVWTATSEPLIAFDFHFHCCPCDLFAFHGQRAFFRAEQAPDNSAGQIAGRPGEGYATAAVATGPFSSTNSPSRASTVTSSPLWISPSSRASARRSVSCFWITRRNGRAP